MSHRLCPHFMPAVEAVNKGLFHVIIANEHTEFHGLVSSSGHNNSHACSNSLYPLVLGDFYSPVVQSSCMGNGRCSQIRHVTLMAHASRPVATSTILGDSLVRVTVSHLHCAESCASCKSANYSLSQLKLRCDAYATFGRLIFVFPETCRLCCSPKNSV